MDDLYGSQHQILQEEFETQNLANAIKKSIVATEIEDKHRGFIESRDMFFLTTIDHRGYPTCSYKGGQTGFLKILNNKTLAFPSFDGNGMFLSMGNITKNSKVGMLLIDFVKPHRIRIHGNASLHRDKKFLDLFHGAEIVVTVEITELFINCPRYIHRYTRIENAKHVPKEGSQCALPQWKRINELQSALPERDRKIAEQLGGTITPEEYNNMVINGET